MKPAILALLLVISACSLNDSSSDNRSLPYPSYNTPYDLCLKEQQANPTMIPGKLSLMFYNETRENIERYFAVLGDEDDIHSKCLYPLDNLTFTSCTVTVPVGQEDYWVCSLGRHSDKPEGLVQVIKEIAV